MKRQFRIGDRVRETPVFFRVGVPWRTGTVDGYDRWSRVVIVWDDKSPASTYDSDTGDIEHLPDESEDA